MRLALLIRDARAGLGVGLVGSEEIDSLNILQATLLAMRRALHAAAGLSRPTSGGRQSRRRASRICLAACTVEAIVGGDANIAAISAASILAKTYRDALMERMDAHYPGFDFAAAQGLCDARRTWRRCARERPRPLHRRSFEPVRLSLCGITIATP